MKKINIKKLLNMYLATVVKEAMDSGELNLSNAHSWAVERNSGIEDRTYINEVTALVKYYTKG